MPIGQILLERMLWDPLLQMIRIQSSCKPFFCPVSQQYVALCTNCSYTLQTFWTNVIGQIWQDQLAQDCIVLINLARVASTYGPLGANGQPTVPLVTAGGLQVPLADNQLAA